MLTSCPTQNHEKLALIWAERRERLIAVRIYYETSVENGCTMYWLNRVDELG